MTDSLYRLSQNQFLRYLIASVGALSVDMGSFILMLHFGILAGLAAAIAYTLGIVAHWVLLSRGVFKEGVAERGMARTQQKVIFFVTTLAGLGLTTAVVSVLVALGVAPIVTKVLAVVLSFTLNWLIRKRYIFRPAVAVA
ncbi:polysaccharide biosynthesis protein GtrA [Erythrobacter sp. SG61-1L]|uniref:GtrA family protein n=1 Tax=Erythrobacter sp. SG61-1L TaxID=1603897 RepID=UPI0006C8E9FA|nr:GtrA family protein [Erythrobacter sp. SG61-1L]KPL69190.1 polysaccharide biosynthesis protein GtrA [Erythrobacter sp. SG61-1L]